MRPRRAMPWVVSLARRALRGGDRRASAWRVVSSRSRSRRRRAAEASPSRVAPRPSTGQLASIVTRQSPSTVKSGPGVVNYTTGDPALWWSLDVTTGAVQTYGSSVPPSSWAVGTSVPQPFGCNNNYNDGYSGGDLYARDCRHRHQGGDRRARRRERRELPGRGRDVGRVRPRRGRRHHPRRPAPSPS